MERGFAQGRGYTADQESLPHASLLKWQVAYTAKEGGKRKMKKRHCPLLNGESSLGCEDCEWWNSNECSIKTIANMLEKIAQTLDYIGERSFKITTREE